jgi:hypothetical protein
MRNKAAPAVGMPALDANAGRPGTIAIEVVATSTSSKRDPPSFVTTVRVYLTLHLLSFSRA